MRKGRHFWHALMFIAICAGIAAIVMLLWNALIPTIIGWAAINYWQAAGLMILCRLLFGGMGHHKMGRRFHRRPHSGHAHIHEMFKDMSFAERKEYIRKRMHECDGDDKQQ